MKTSHILVGFTLCALIGIYWASDRTWACSENGGGFLPENTLNIPLPPPNGIGVPYNVSETDFNRILDRIEGNYQSIVREHGGQLQFIRAWSDGTVNAYADRQGGIWIVKMYGGLARHPDMSPDGFALIACHELGHHLGGVPRYTGKWAATEGQADYFSTLKCLRKVWNTDNNRDALAGVTVPASVTSQCEKSFTSDHEISLCSRTALAGMAAARVSYAIAGGQIPDFTRPDPTQVGSTYESHPAPQCRLDTYFNASVCQKSYLEEIGQSDVITGVCAEEAAATFGFRPHCWYKPGTGGISPTPTPNPTPAPGVPTAPPGSIRGQNDYQVQNPNEQVPIQYDVSKIPGAAGVYVEVLRAGAEFSQPNSTTPDPARLVFGTNAGAIGIVYLTPIQNLPSRGIYRYRVLALDAAGTTPVSRSSNASTLRY